MAKTAEEEIRKLLASNPDLRVDGYGDFQSEVPVSIKRHKYSAQKTVVDGITFDSKREAIAYTRLKSLEQAGEVKDLKLQPEYTLQEKFVDKQGNRHRAIVYKADFSFVDTRTGELTVVDVKGYPTPVFRLKWKLLLYHYPNVRFEIWK